MRILAVDTALGACSAALLEDEHILASEHVAMERGHAEALAPMVERVMHGHAFAIVDRLAVTTGPGTFTGQRIGLAFMRALRVALQKPLIGITSLAAMAEQARAETGAARAAAIHDAKRGEVYLEIAGDRPRLLRFEDARDRLADLAGVALAGTGAPHMAEALPSAIATAIRAPDAVWVARLARSKPDEGVPHPLYLRAPDAKLPASR